MCIAKLLIRIRHKVVPVVVAVAPTAEAPVAPTEVLAESTSGMGLTSMVRAFTIFRPVCVVAVLLAFAVISARIRLKL